MADAPIAIASAVALPDNVPLSPPRVSTKRRQESPREEGNKRRKPSDDGNDDDEISQRSEHPEQEEARSSRRVSGQLEERKRGQRLFGNLLGTLSQSSSSAAQKRRIDIERKQREKLKLQTEQRDEKRREDLSRIKKIREKEQIKYDEQSMLIRHSNSIAISHFLRTKTLPVLYYKPWELRQEEDDVILQQIENAKKEVEREQEDFERRKANEIEQEELKDNIDLVEVMELDSAGKDRREGEANGFSLIPPKPIAEDTHDMKHAELAGSQGNGQPEMQPRKQVQQEHDDDGGDDMLEGDEDTVLY